MKLPKIVINPKVVVQVYRGMIDLIDSTKGVSVELRDYDIDTCTDEEIEGYGQEVIYDKTGRYVIR